MNNLETALAELINLITKNWAALFMILILFSYKYARPFLLLILSNFLIFGEMNFLYTFAMFLLVAAAVIAKYNHDSEIKQIIIRLKHENILDTRLSTGDINLNVFNPSSECVDDDYNYEE